MVSKVAHPFPSLSLGEVVAVTKWMPSGHHSKAVESLACACDVRYTVKWDLFASNRFRVKLLHAEFLHKSKYSCVLLSAHPYHHSAGKTLASTYIANVRLLNSLRKFGVWKPFSSSISVITMSLNNYHPLWQLVLLHVADAMCGVKMEAGKMKLSFILKYIGTN